MAAEDSRWSLVEPVSDDAATEGGKVIADEIHDFGARITLEQTGTASFAITCGIYGWMMHTRYLTGETQARQAFEDMKRDLDAIMLQIPLRDDPGVGRKMDLVAVAIERFVDKFPT